MAIISIEKINLRINGKETKKITLKVILSCDECHKIYEAPSYSKKRATKLKHHFCSRVCSSKSLSDSNGVLRNQFKQICLEKYDAECFAASKVGRNKLNEVCLEKFGQDNVERQVSVLRQWVDFYIKSIETYIQVDGVYWHGLNRDIEYIKQGNTSQDIKIYKQILRDQKLNEYMQENNLKIVRITDEQVKELSDEKILELIEEV